MHQPSCLQCKLTRKQCEAFVEGQKEEIMIFSMKRETLSVIVLTLWTGGLCIGLGLLGIVAKIQVYQSIAAFMFGVLITIYLLKKTQDL